MFIIDTDMSNVRIGGVLSPIQDGWEPLAVRLNKAKGNYCITQ
jgi:hypothetical protein